MNDIANPPLPVPREDDPMASVGRLWPSPEYTRQVERLRAAVGEKIYLVEITATEVQLGVRITGKPYVLLGLSFSIAGIAKLEFASLANLTSCWVW